MEKQADLNIMHNRAMQILSGMSVDEVYNDYMSKMENIINSKDEESIKKALNIVDNFKYFLVKRYFDSKQMPESTRMLYNLKLEAIRTTLVENLFEIKEEELEHQKIMVK